MAPKTKYCFVIDENGAVSQKTTFIGYNQDMMKLNFKVFVDIENGEKISSKPNLNWKRDLHGVKIPHREFQYLECDNNEICKQCEISRRKNCFECEVAAACEKCLKRIAQMKNYTTDINKLKQLPENDFGYMLRHYEREID